MKFIFLYLILAALPCVAQEKLVKDIDGDQILDTIYLDLVKSRIICIMSLQNFKTTESQKIELDTDQNGIRATKSGFELWFNFMRAGNACQFRYNPEAKKIQLIGMSEYEFGNAANDGSGEGSVNLLTNTYVGNWNYFDTRKDRLIKLPEIKQRLVFAKVFLEVFDGKILGDFLERSAELYEKQKKLAVK